jgi:hypothetical protein
MARPSDLPEWNTDETNNIEPNSGRKASGLTTNDEPTSAEFNWWMNTVYKWTNYLQQHVDVGFRLTLTSGTPVTTSDVTGATTIYCTPWKGRRLPLYNGTAWDVYESSELSNITTNSSTGSAGPAAVANNSNYDLFAWANSGTPTLTRGFAWTSDTARGTGAGTTELELFEGRYVNKFAITNGPAARCGLYMGTVRSDGSAQINDTLAKRHVWNMYNRVRRAMRRVDTTASWTYSSATIRQANGSTANQLDFVRGLDEDAVDANVIIRAYNSSAGEIFACGIGIDSTTVDSGVSGQTAVATALKALPGVSALSVSSLGIGRHYLAWLEVSSPTGTTTFFGETATARSGIQGSCFA